MKGAAVPRRPKPAATFDSVPDDLLDRASQLTAAVLETPYARMRPLLADLILAALEYSETQDGSRLRELIPSIESTVRLRRNPDFVAALGDADLEDEEWRRTKSIPPSQSVEDAIAELRTEILRRANG
jgi:hypothetical protein